MYRERHGGLRARLQRIKSALYLKGEETDKTPEVSPRVFIVFARNISNFQKNAYVVYELHNFGRWFVGKNFLFFFFVLFYRHGSGQR